MNFLKHLRQREKTEKGNIFLMLFAAVGVVGALGVGSTTILKGPVSTMVKTNQATMIENRAELDLKLMVNNIITTRPDCDSDGTMEAMEWRDADVGEPPVITGGGYLPKTIAGNTTDPWKRQFGYCVWDNGSRINYNDADINLDCLDVTDTQKRLIGSPLTTETFVAVVSAGPDQKFQTSCQDFTIADANSDGDLEDVGDTELVLRTANSDDVVISYTYDELKSVMGDNWLFSTNLGADDDALKTGQGVEISNDVNVGGVLDMNLLGGTLSLSDVSGAACNVANEGQMFRDASVTPPAIMLCQSGSFVSIGGGGATASNCAGVNTGICIGFDPEAANCKVNNGGPFVEVDTDVAGGVMRDVWTDGTYIYINGETVTYAYSFDGTSLTQLAQFTSGNPSLGLVGDGNYIYVGQRLNGIRALTFDGTSFSSLDTIGLTGSISDMAVDDNFIYVASEATGVRALTFDGTAFTLVDTFDTSGTAVKVWTDDNYVYVADRTDGVHALTFDGTSFTLIDTYNTSGTANSVWGDGNYIYVADDTSGAHAFTFNGTSFTLIDTFNTNGAGDVWGDGTYIYVADGSTDGLKALNFDGSFFTEVDVINTNSVVFGVHGDGTHIYVADGNGGLAAFSGFACTSISTKPEIDTKTDHNIKIYGWGASTNNQLVDDAYFSADQISPVPIDGLSFLKNIDTASGGQSCGIDKNNDVWCWGINDYAKAGQAAYAVDQPPMKVEGISNVKSVSGGNSHTCVLKYDGTAWCWGRNHVGQLGRPSGSGVPPEQVSNITNFDSIVAGGNQTCGVTKNKEAWCWGSDDNGGLGNGSILTANQNTPSKVKNLNDVVQVGFSGFYAACALKSNGDLWCWGADNVGQLGNGSATGDQEKPVKIDIDNVIQIASNPYGFFGCALKKDGTAWCWGDGIGDSPTQRGNITDFVKIDTLNLGGCGLRANGEIWCWGSDNRGQLGNGAATGTQSIAVQTDTTVKFYDFTSGGDTVISLTKDVTDGDESLPVAPVMIQQSHDAGEAVGSHGLAITYNGATNTDRVGIALTVDEDTASGDPASVRIETRINSDPVYEMRFQTNTTNRLRLRKDNFVIGYEIGVVGSLKGQLQIGAHDGNWSEDLDYRDGLLVSQKGVTTLNPSYFGVNSETGETTILSGRELLIQHTDDTGATITPVASFLGASGSTFFGEVNVRGGDLTINAYTDTANEFAAYNFFRYGGDETTPAIIGSNDTLGEIRFRGYGNGNYTGPASITSSTPVAPSSGAGDINAELYFNTGLAGISGGNGNTLKIGRTGNVRLDTSGIQRSLLTIGGRGAADEGVKFSNDTTCASAVNDAGTIRWTGTTYEYCDGSTWLPLVPSASTPSACTDDEVFYDVSTGFRMTCGLLSNGQVVCWGQNEQNVSLGNDSPNNPEPDLIPIPRTVLDDVIKISTGGEASCALTKAGEIKCWGDTNSAGNTGTGSVTNLSSPMAIISNEKFIDFDMEAGHACGVTENNKVLCWGGNGNGELGDGTTNNSFIPVEAYGIDNAVMVSVGWSHSCALLSDKTVKCWGANSYGELGRGTTTAAEPIPGTVGGLTDVAVVDVSGAFTAQNSCAVKTDGTVWCWGLDGASSGDQNTPTQIVGITDAIDVSVGWVYACALREGGTVQCWGSSTNGKTGDGSVVTAAKIDAGRVSNCAVLQDGSAQCWGSNSHGNLGGGIIGGNFTAPVDVINPLSCNSDKYVFVTSEVYDGNLGGLEGADAICQSHADRVRLPGTYKAWLSDSTGSPSTRFNQLPDTQNYKLVDDTIIANGWSDLIDGTLDNEIDIDENSVSIGTQSVWTNTMINGDVNSINSCNSWRSTSLSSFPGVTNQSNSQWTDSLIFDPCGLTSHLYCFQQ